jgi:hypothetical protein
LCYGAYDHDKGKTVVRRWRKVSGLFVIEAAELPKGDYREHDSDSSLHAFACPW